MDEMSLNDFKNDNTEIDNSENNSQITLGDVEDNKINETKEVINNKPDNKIDDIKLIDISNFKIVKETTKFEHLLDAIDNSENGDMLKHLINGKKYYIEAYKGIDIKRLQNIIINDNNTKEIERLLAILKEFYNHLKHTEIDSFNKWLSTITANDLDDVYAAIFRATVYNQDTVLVSCDSCKSNSLVVMDKPFEELYMRFNSEKDKEKYMGYYNEDNDFTCYEGRTYIAQISNDIAIEVSQISLYDTLIVSKALLKNYPETTDNFKEALDYALYIKNIYKIEDDKLVAVDMYSSKIKHNNTVEDDVNKLRLKIKHINSLLKKVGIKEVNNIEKAIIKVEKEEKLYTYVTPQTICPKCEHEIAEVKDIGAQMLDLVLLRANAIVE